MIRIELPRAVADQLKLTYLVSLRGEHASLPAHFACVSYTEVEKILREFFSQCGLAEGDVFEADLQVKVELGADLPIATCNAAAEAASKFH